VIELRKWNNKGFAITTVVYGLSIMGMLIVAMLMAIMSSERSNNNQISKTIEEELNRYSKTDTSFSASGSGLPTAQEYVVPSGESGWYRIELWGAQGGTNGGRGAYTSGIIRLEAGDVLYFYVGSQLGGSNGGQSTDVRIASGPYTGSAGDESALRSYETRIMVAAGGGAAAGASGGTLYGYTAYMTAKDGVIQSRGTTATSGDATFDLVGGNLAGIPSSAKSSVTQLANSFTARPTSGGAGGSGYVSSTDPNIGGDSFISGFAGCRAVVAGVNTKNPKYIYKEYTYNASGDGSYASTGRAYYFLDGRMLAGVNNGHGRARIERVVADDSESEDGTKSVLPVLNQKLKGVNSITDCIEDGQGFDMRDAVIKAIAGGDEVSFSGPEVVTSRNVGSTRLTCKRVNLSSTTDLDEIGIWHVGMNGKDVKRHYVYINSYSNVLKANNTPTGISETEDVTGYHFSAYQPDYTQSLPESGNYYIIPVLAENKAFTAHESAEYDANPISIQYINGYKRQNWSIERIKDPKINPGGAQEYKIIELARFKSLSIYKDENKVFNTVRANDAFNELSRNDIEIWKINPIGDGTYQINTVAQVFDSGTPTGNLIPQTNATVGDEYNNVIIGKTNWNTARVKFIKIDY